MRSYQMRVRPLNHTDWMVRPFGTSSKHEDSVCERIRNYDLVMNCVVRETMDSTSEHRPLSGNHSFRGGLSICQPGKCRHTRLRYTIRDKNLVSFGVVGQCHGIPNPGVGVPAGALRISRFGIVLPLAPLSKARAEWSPQFETQISLCCGSTATPMG